MIIKKILIVGLIGISLVIFFVLVVFVVIFEGDLKVIVKFKVGMGVVNLVDLENLMKLIDLLDLSNLIDFGIGNIGFLILDYVLFVNFGEYEVLFME